MKFHAYVGQTGYVRKSAYKVKAERDTRYRGGPSPEKFFSLHGEGHRKPLEHVRGPGRPFFRYGDGYDDGGPGGPGESLEHLLFKDAIASLERTRLSLRGHEDINIIITHGETEKLIPGASRAYRSDVYIKFESKSTSELELKWSGELYIEIHKTNLVEPEKHDEVRALGIPMIEVSIPPSLMYRYGGEETTDERERDYVQWLKGVLESDRGFVQGIVLSNPSSTSYLNKKLSEVQVALASEQQKFSSASRELVKYKEENNKLCQSVNGTQEMLNELRVRLDAQKEKEASLGKKIIELTRNLQGSNEKIIGLTKKLEKMILAVISLTLLALCLCLFFWWL